MALANDWLFFGRKFRSKKCNNLVINFTFCYVLFTELLAISTSSFFFFTDSMCVYVYEQY